jgi:tetratricopeptide (TPR) repeat protein
MKSQFGKYYFLLFIFSLHFNLSVRSQILKDTSTFRLIRQGVDYIYNLQFDEANAIYEKIKSKYPDHPVPSLFKGMMTYWKYFPLIPTSAASSLFEKELYTCIEQCEKAKQISDEPEYLLAELGARGLLLLYYADNKLSMNVVAMASRTYNLVMHSFDYTNSYYDFYFFTGLYNYYREAYPEAYPVYKAFAILFPKGDRAKGLKELKLAAKNSLFLRAESCTFLTGIYISFENNYPSALIYSKWLHEQYPQNHQFIASFIKNLLLTKRYVEAEKCIEQNGLSVNSYFLFQKKIFRGIILEKKYNNLSQAEKQYKEAIKISDDFGNYANEYVAYAYFGLSRIMKEYGNDKLSRSYYKKAMDLAAFENVNFNE